MSISSTLLVSPVDPKILSVPPLDPGILDQLAKHSKGGTAASHPISFTLPVGRKAALSATELQLCQKLHAAPSNNAPDLPGAAAVHCRFIIPLSCGSSVTVTVLQCYCHVAAEQPMSGSGVDICRSVN